MPIIDEFGREIPGISSRSSNNNATNLHSTSIHSSTRGHYLMRTKSPSPPISRYSERKRHYSPNKHPSSPPAASRRPRTTTTTTAPASTLIIERYVTDPMLCEYVYNTTTTAQQGKDNNGVVGVDSATTTNDSTSSSINIKQQEHGVGNYYPDEVGGGGGNEASVERNGDNNKNSNTSMNESLAGNVESKKTETYDEYRKRYALNYIRAFFNQHMDDSWFRNRYSPLLKRRVLEDEYERAATEAKAMMEQVHHHDTTTTTSTTTSSSGTDSGVMAFISQARLGHGVKREMPTGSNNALPKVHAFSCVAKVIKLVNVPPHVSEDQISHALQAHSTMATQSTMHVYSGAVSTTTLLRDVISVFASVEIKNDVLHNLAKHVDSVPRKDDQGKYTLALSVECSDAYGRAELDEPGNIIASRKAIVSLSTEPIPTAVTVLSASLSSKERIPNDKAAAIMIGRALDVKRKIPRQVRLEDLMEQLPPDTSDEDCLDVAIAYLRRVHLFSFYNACSFGDSFINVLNGKTSAGTVHLRLQGADELLTSHDDDDNDKTDLLVMRLDDAIQRSMEATSDWVNSEYMISQEDDARANELELLEQQTQQEWIEQHILVDGEDERARCAFHFCRKLFKDGSFLRKHLLKKHSEYLRAEVAKCHDAFMMQAWEKEEIRPVPQVLVDCGSNFGLQPSPVVGAVPMADDPEPELWRKEEERRKRLEEKEEMRHRRRTHSHGGGEDGGPPPLRRNVNAFVDVDDMKEEKVELKFDNVEIPVEAPKKKKRKKLL